MKNPILILLVLCITISLSSCNSKPSLQKYFVEKMDDSSFLVVNIPIKLQELYTSDLSKQEAKTLKSIKKMNLLVFRTTSEEVDRYPSEAEQLSRILKQDRFEELITFRALESSGSVLFEGDPSDIDEGIIWLQNPEYGFGLIRVLGNKMNPAALMALVNKIDRNKLETEGAAQLAPLMDALKGLREEAKKRSD